MCLHFIPWGLPCEVSRSSRTFSTDPEQSAVYLNGANFFRIDSRFVHTCLVHSWCAGVPLHTTRGFHILVLPSCSELSV